MPLTDPEKYSFMQSEFLKRILPRDRFENGETHFGLNKFLDNLVFLG